jgi:hypothetical protein
MSFEYLYLSLDRLRRQEPVLGVSKGRGQGEATEEGDGAKCLWG